MSFPRRLALRRKEAVAEIIEVRVIYNEKLPWELLKRRLGSHSFILRVRQSDGSLASWAGQTTSAWSMVWPLQEGGRECTAKAHWSRNKERKWNKQDSMPPGVHDIQQITLSKWRQDNMCAHFWAAAVVRAVILHKHAYSYENMLVEATNGLCVARWSALISSQVNKYDKLLTCLLSTLWQDCWREKLIHHFLCCGYSWTSHWFSTSYTLTHYPFHIQSFCEQTLLAAIVLFYCDKLRNIVWLPKLLKGY